MDVGEPPDKLNGQDGDVSVLRHCTPMDDYIWCVHGFRKVAMHDNATGGDLLFTF